MSAFKCISFSLCRWVTLALLFSVMLAHAFAGMSITPPANYVDQANFGISYGLGTPLPGKYAMVYVIKPNGERKKVGPDAENVSDLSQYVTYFADMPGDYVFQYCYSYPSQGIGETIWSTLPAITLHHNQVGWTNVTTGWSGATTTSYIPPGQNIIIKATVQNTGTSTWDSTYYMQLSDQYDTHIGYVNVGGLAPQGTTQVTFSYTVPSPTTPTSYTYHLQGMQNGVMYFDDKVAVTFIVDNTPTTTFTLTPTSLTAGTMVDAKCTVGAATYSNIVNEAIDYWTPSGSDWVSGTIAAGSRWEGTAANSAVLEFKPTLNEVGTWKFRARGQDSVGQLSPFVEIDPVVSQGAIAINSFTYSITSASPSALIYASPSSGTTPLTTSIVWSTSNASSFVVTRNGTSVATSGTTLSNSLTTGNYVYLITAQPSTFSATLTWSATNASSYQISGPNSYSWSSTSATSVSVTSPGTYILTATGSSGSVTNTVTLNAQSAATASTTVVVSASATADSDGDSIPDSIETQLGTNPNKASQSDSSNSTQLNVHEPEN